CCHAINIVLFSSANFHLYPSLSSLPLTFLFCDNPSTAELYTLSLHDALPISQITAKLQEIGVGGVIQMQFYNTVPAGQVACIYRSEEHTSELQSRFDLVCRLLLEKKK